MLSTGVSGTVPGVTYDISDLSGKHSWGGLSTSLDGFCSLDGRTAGGKMHMKLGSVEP